MLKIININDALRLKGFTCLAVVFSFAFDREKMLSTVNLRRAKAAAASDYLDHIVRSSFWVVELQIIFQQLHESRALMCETDVKSYTESCRTFNKITPRFSWEVDKWRWLRCARQLCSDPIALRQTRSRLALWQWFLARTGFAISEPSQILLEAHSTQSRPPSPQHNPKAPLCKTFPRLASARLPRNISLEIR